MLALELRLVAACEAADPRLWAWKGNSAWFTGDNGDRLSTDMRAFWLENMIELSTGPSQDYRQTIAGRRCDWALDAPPRWCAMMVREQTRGLLRWSDDYAAADDREERRDCGGERSSDGRAWFSDSNAGCLLWAVEFSEQGCKLQKVLQLSRTLLLLRLSVQARRTYVWAGDIGKQQDPAHEPRSWPQAACQVGPGSDRDQVPRYL